MKTFLKKLFLTLSATLCMMQGLLLLGVGFGRLSPQKLVVLYNQLLSMPAAFRSIQVIGGIFIALGFVLLLLASRTRHIPKMLTIEQDGQILNIAYATVIDFIEQVGSQDPYVTDFKADFTSSPKLGIIIPIQIELSGVPSVQQVLNDIENTLRVEIENVFGLRKFKFDFNIEGVSIDPKKKYFASHEKEKAPLTAAKVSHASATIAPEELTPKNFETPITEELEEIGAVPIVHKTKTVHLKTPLEIEESLAERRSDDEVEQLIASGEKVNAKKSSLMTRILWGK